MGLTKPVLLKESEFGEYDAFVGRHPHGWVCATSGWIKVLERSFPRITACIYVIREPGDGGSIRSALPLYCVRSAFARARLISVPFATLSDPLFSGEESLDEFVPAFGGDRGGGRGEVEIRVSFSRKRFPDLGRHRSVKIHKCHSLSLETPPDVIYRGFHRTCIRQNIARAEKTGIRVREAGTGDDIRSFYKLYSGTRKDLCLPAMPYDFFRSVWDILVPEGRAMFLIAELGEAEVASMMLLRYGKRVSAEAMGWDTGFVANRPVAFIYWQAIKRAIEDGFSVFDFGRTDPANTSLMDFKGHWGASVTDLTTYRFSDRPIRNLQLSREKAYVRHLGPVIRNIPDGIYHRISDFFYRYIG